MERDRPKKSFFSSVDGARFADSLLAQPSLYAAAATFCISIWSQSSPADFLPRNYLGYKINGISTKRYLIVPLTAVSMSYVAVADHIAAGRIMGGHLSGLGISALCGAAMLAASKVSLVYPVLGASYIFFGLTHHYRALKTYYDDRPVVSLVDVVEIGSHILSRR